jgi:hypothetical protein
MLGVHDYHAAAEKAIELGLLESPGLLEKVGSDEEMCYDFSDRAIAKRHG